MYWKFLTINKHEFIKDTLQLYSSI